MQKKYFYRVNTDRKEKTHIHLLHKISSLFIPLYKNVKAKQKKSEQIRKTIYICKGRREQKNAENLKKLSELKNEKT